MPFFITLPSRNCCPPCCPPPHVPPPSTICSSADTGDEQIGIPPSTCQPSTTPTTCRDPFCTEAISVNPLLVLKLLSSAINPLRASATVRVSVPLSLAAAAAAAAAAFAMRFLRSFSNLLFRFRKERKVWSLLRKATWISERAASKAL